MSAFTTDYKYRIAELLCKFPTKENRRIRREIREALGLTFVTFSRRLYALKSETLGFDSMDMPIIAQKLGVSIEELYNDPIPSVVTPC